MNKSRRKRLSSISEEIEQLMSEIAEITAEEQESYENFPESLQDSERGEKMQECISLLEDISSNGEEICNSILECL